MRHCLFLYIFTGRFALYLPLHTALDILFMVVFDRYRLGLIGLMRVNDIRVLL